MNYPNTSGANGNCVRKPNQDDPNPDNDIMDIRTKEIDDNQVDNGTNTDKANMKNTSNNQNNNINHDDNYHDISITLTRKGVIMVLNTKMLIMLLLIARLILTGRAIPTRTITGV